MLYEFRHMAEVDKDFENFGADYIFDKTGNSLMWYKL